MGWYEDLRHIDWNGRRFTVLDSVKEEGRVLLGLAPFDEVAAVAKARDAGQPRPLPADLTWVEEQDGGFRALTRKEAADLMKRKRDRALAAFKKP